MGRFSIYISCLCSLHPCSQSTFRGRAEIGWVGVSVPAYTTTLYVMVDRVQGGGRAPQPSLGRANFSIMMECTPESDHCHSVCTLCLCLSITAVPNNQKTLLSPSIGKWNWPNGGSASLDGGGGGVGARGIYLWGSVWTTISFSISHCQEHERPRVLAKCSQFC